MNPKAACTSRVKVRKNARASGEQPNALLDFQR